MARRDTIRDDKVVIAGRAAEVNPVLHALLAHGIEDTSAHSHMLDEDSRLFFMHFWAGDDEVQLGQGLRAQPWDFEHRQRTSQR